MFDSKCFNSAMGTVIKLTTDTLTCFSAKPSIFHMAQATTAILMSMCIWLVHMDIKIAVVACASKNAWSLKRGMPFLVGN